jgi:uncharacterized protein (TIGR02444 family)
LQDAFGLDVNVLLCCCWLGCSGRGRLTRGELAPLTARLASWNAQVIAPLRQVRRRLRELAPVAQAPLEALRQGVLAREIDAEHVAQLALGEPFALRSCAESDPARRCEDVAHNLACYAALTVSAQDAALHGSLDDLLQAVCAVTEGVTRYG